MPAVAESLNRVFRGSRRKHTGTRPGVRPCSATLALRAKLISIYLINNEQFNAPVRLQPSKSYHVELVASKKLTTGIHPIITKFNEQS
jgi:hypothetical protein